MRGGIAVNYTPEKHPVTAFKATVRLCASQVCDSVWDAPIRLQVVFVMPRPKSKVWKTRPMPRYRHGKKPDLDNLEKSVMDALTGIAWRDDSQVVCKHSEKWVAAGDEQPHCKITIRELEN